MEGLSLCPLCGGTTAIEEHPTLRWRCAVCAGPRVPAEVEGLVRSNREGPTLVEAGRLRAATFGWRAAMVMLGIVGLGLAALAALISMFAAVTGIVLAAVAAALVIAALRMRARANKRGRELETKLDEAWMMVAEEILERRGRMSAAALARAMQTDEAHAETMLTLLSVSPRVRVEALAEHAELHDGADAAEDDPARQGAKR